MSLFLSHSFKYNNFLIINRNFSKATTKKNPFRKHPHTRDNRPLVLKQRQINERHEEAAKAIDLPWRIVTST